MPNIQLHLTPGHRDSKVLVDGVDIAPGLRGLGLEARLDHLTTLTLDLNLIEDARIDAEGVQIVVPDATREALVALGWKPPGAG